VRLEKRVQNSYLAAECRGDNRLYTSRLQRMRVYYAIIFMQPIMAAVEEVWRRI
jgi:hypothetical protein